MGPTLNPALLHGQTSVYVCVVCAVFGRHSTYAAEDRTIRPSDHEVCRP